VNFSCTSDGSAEYIYWKYTEYFGGSTFVIFGRRGRNERLFDERFVKTDNGSISTLTIRNVRKLDAGIYICIDSDSTKYWSAQLTVIGQLIELLSLLISSVLAQPLVQDKDTK